jgi:hypothetical protein
MDSTGSSIHHFFEDKKQQVRRREPEGSWVDKTQQVDTAYQQLLIISSLRYPLETVSLAPGIGICIGQHWMGMVVTAVEDKLAAHDRFEDDMMRP